MILPSLYWYDEAASLGCFEDICNKSTYLFPHKKRHWNIFSENFFFRLAALSGIIEMYWLE